MLGDKRHAATVAVRVRPTAEDGNGGNEFVNESAKLRYRAEDSAGELRMMAPHFMDAVRGGIRDAFARGPLLGHPLVNVSVELDEGGTVFGPDTSVGAVRAAAVIAVASAVKAADPRILEPHMDVEVFTPNRFAGAILSDLSRVRLAQINVRGRARAAGAVTASRRRRARST